MNYELSIVKSRTTYQAIIWFPVLANSVSVGKILPSPIPNGIDKWGAPMRFLSKLIPETTTCALVRGTTLYTKMMCMSVVMESHSQMQTRIYGLVVCVDFVLLLIRPPKPCMLQLIKHQLKMTHVTHGTHERHSESVYYFLSARRHSATPCFWPAASIATNSGKSLSERLTTRSARCASQ